MIQRAVLKDTVGRIRPAGSQLPIPVLEHNWMRLNIVLCTNINMYNV